MPLLDHFNPPLSRTHPWRSFHNAWAAAMARLLNQGILPEGYYAVPAGDHNSPIEINVATLHSSSQAGDGATPCSWEVPAPALTMTIELPPLEQVEVHVMFDDGDPRLAAAIELVSPANKDRPQTREAFATKCVNYLRQGAGLVVIDTVTTRRADLQGTILSMLRATSHDGMPDGLSAISYQATGQKEETQQLQLWPAAIALGSSLPTLPLWIASDFSVPLDPDASYLATCLDLRIRVAG